MDLTAREKIIVRALANKIESLIADFSDIDELENQLAQTEAKAAKVFGNERADMILTGIVETIEANQALKEIREGGLIGDDIIKEAIGGAVAAEMEKRNAENTND